MTRKSKILLASLLILVFVLITIFLFLQSRRSQKGERGVSAIKLALTSPDFKNGETMAGFNTCDGVDYSPALKISGVAPNVQSLALVMEDLDAPGGLFTHWLVWNIKTEVVDVPGNGTPAGGITGINDFRKQQYNGPCPPPGDKPHRYQFVLYALDRGLSLSPSARRNEFDKAIKGRVLDRAFIELLYKR